MAPVILLPEGGQSSWIIGCCRFVVYRGGAQVHHPGNGGGIGEIGGKFCVRTQQEFPLTGQSPDFAGQVMLIIKKGIPDPAMGGRADLVNAE